MRVSIKLKNIASKDDKGLVVLQVEDNGHGIAPDIKEKVLEPFFTTRGDGTGLGLPTVLRIVESHGARLRIADSSLGGALFSVSFPLLQQRNKAGLAPKIPHA